MFGPFPDSSPLMELLSFQWVPGHAGLSGNKLEGSLAKTRLTHSFFCASIQLAPVIAKIRHTRYSLWR